MYSAEEKLHLQHVWQATYWSGTTEMQLAVCKITIQTFKEKLGLLLCEARMLCSLQARN